MKVGNWLSLLAIGLAFIFLSFGLFYRPEVLRVGRVEIVNSKGKTVAVLGVSPTDGGVLLLHDANGTLRVAVGLTAQGDAAIDVNDEKGRQCVTIEVGRDGKVKVLGIKGGD